MFVRTAIWLLCTFPLALTAQAADAKAKAALAPLQKLVGQWDGEARGHPHGGSGQVVRQHYDVTQGAGGRPQPQGHWARDDSCRKGHRGVSGQRHPLLRRTRRAGFACARIRAG
jgi:hypothetical protein